jgi:hypothetical protein
MEMWPRRQEHRGGILLASVPTLALLFARIKLVADTLLIDV